MTINGRRTDRISTWLVRGLEHPRHTDTTRRAALAIAAMLVTTCLCTAGCSSSHSGASSTPSPVAVQAKPKVTLHGEVEGGISISKDPSTCVGYALHVDVENAAGKVLGVGLADVWKLVPMNGEYSCRAGYTVTVVRQDVYKLHANNIGFTDVSVQAAETSSGVLPVISGHLH